MIVESLVGTIVGGLLRLLPEGLKFWQSKKDSDHEYRMAQLNFDSLKFQAEKSIDLKRLDGEIQMSTGELQAIIEGNKVQGTQVGIKWVDALNQSVRPVLTYYYATMYAMVKLAVYCTYLTDGIDWKQSMIMLWSPDDMAVWASIVSFFFLDRTLRKSR